MSDSRKTTMSAVVIHAQELEPAWLTGFRQQMGNYELEASSSEAHEKVIGLLGGGEPSKASEALYKGCPEIPQFSVEQDVKRQELITILSGCQAIRELKKKDIGESDPITLEALIGKEGAEAYKKACQEESASRSFRDAVFLSSTQTYEGKKWDKRLVVWVGGPSASGKSYATNDLLELIADEKDNELPLEKGNEKAEPEIGENHVVSIDGGKEREVSQMRQLVLQIALARGYTGIADLTEYDERLKTKQHVQNAVLESKNKLNMVIPATFTDPFKNLKGLSKEIDGFGENQVEQIYAQVREAPEDDKRIIFKKTVATMGGQRAFGAVNITAEDIKPNRKLSVESKKYDPENFDRGAEKSDARRAFFDKNLKHSNYRYYEITFDLIFVEKTKDGKLSKVEPPFHEGVFKTNTRVYNALNKYIDSVPTLEARDFTKKVWVKRKGDWIGSETYFKPVPDEIKDYACISLAAYKTAQVLLKRNEDFETSWNNNLKNISEELDIKNFRSSIHKGGNPTRLNADITKKKSMPADLLKDIREFPRSDLHPVSNKSELHSAPVIETIASNQTLETLKNQTSFPVKITKEKKDKNNVLQSINFESNNQNESKHVKFEAEISKKDINRVVYKIQPGSAGKNSSNTPEMKATYALLVKVAFEAHFANPKTKNRQFIISVLPNLGSAREEAFVTAIIEEAKNRKLNQAQIKLMLPDGKHFKEKSITELHEPDARSRHHPPI